jgi:hypothetical protein
MVDNFAIMILSHGRANNVLTVNTLRKHGYTGKCYIIIDDEDDQADDYINNFGKENVIIFNKCEIGKTFDIMDNFDGRGVPTYARNAFHRIAKDLGLTYFLELEDDYFCFRQRYEKDGQIHTRYVTDFDALIDHYIEFLNTSGAACISFAQTGDYIGGLNSCIYKQGIMRKAMNSFFCRVDRPFQFFGRFNDDVNCYIDNGKRGMLFFTTSDMCLDQPVTQQNDGGITELYKTYGTYVKSFYSVMLCPSCIKVSELGTKHKRIHHVITWENAVPKIISDKFKKV